MKSIKIKDLKEAMIDYISANEIFNPNFNKIKVKNIDYNFKCEHSRNIKEPINKKYISEILYSLIDEIIEKTKRMINEFNEYDEIKNYDNLPDNIKIVLVDLNYDIENLENNFDNLHSFIYYIKKNDLIKAGLLLEHSIWYENSGIRGKRAVINLFNTSYNKIII